MKFSHRFFIYGPFALFVLLAVGLGIRWWTAADAFSARLEARNGHEIAPGVTLRFAQKRIAGFPFRLDAIFTNFELDVATPHGPVIWRTPQFAMHALTYGREQTVLEAAGLERFDWTGMDGKHRAFEFVPGSLHASAIEEDGALSRFDLDIVGVGSKALTAAHIQFHFRRSPARDALDVFATAEGVRLSPRLNSVFGDDLKLVKLAATVAPAKPLSGLLAGREAWPAVLDAWTSARGRMNVDQIELSLGVLDATGKGAVSLDSARRPAGILDLKFADFERFLEQSRARHMNGAGGSIANALLDRAGKAGSNEAGIMGVVVGAKDGVFYIGDEPAGLIGPLY